MPPALKLAGGFLLHGEMVGKERGRRPENQGEGWMGAGCAPIQGIK